MVNFKKLEGPCDIPIYFQKMPGMVTGISMGWMMFVGGADDESVGAKGLFHWFEHVPFRGTKKYPGGYSEIKKPFMENGVFINATTSSLCTTYYATCPKRIWRESLSIITDLMSQPLLDEKAIHAEREIIFQEITQRKAKSGGFVFYKLFDLLWPGHPLGHHVLGSTESLNSMTPDLLRKAQMTHYDRSRAALFVAGDLEEKELFDEVGRLADTLPSNALSPRSGTINYGPLPKWRPGETTTIQTDFQSSTVLILFPIPEGTDQYENSKHWDMLGGALEFGGLASPLLKVLREERGLVYHASIIDYILPGGGGYWGLMAEAQNSKIEEIIKAFKDVLRDPRAYDATHIRNMKTGIRGSIEIKPIDITGYRASAQNRLVDTGRVYSDEEFLSELDSITPEQVKAGLERLDMKDARTFIFKGRDDR